MEVKTLYRYERKGGGTTVSPVKPACEYTELYRLIADEGMELVKDGVHTDCVDTDTLDGWAEIEKSEEDIEVIGENIG